MMLHLRLLSLCLPVVLLAGCGGGTIDALRSSADSVNANLPPVTVDPNKPLPASTGQLTFVGRTLPMDPADPMHVRFAWAGVGVGMHFNGTGVSASLNDIPATYMGHTGNAYYDVVVDGNVTTSFHASPTQTTYPLAQNLPMGEHTVWMNKRTEGMIGSAELHSVVVADGQLLDPPAHKTRTIEVIGASADVGYGVEATNCGGYQDAQENANKAWPQLAANQLDAEVHQLACSGKGLVLNIDPAADPTYMLPVVYPYADLNVITSQWDFDSWKADAVLLDMGANDYVGAGGNLDDTTFVPAYVKFLQTIAQHYPHAALYVVVNATQTGDLRTKLVAAMQQVVMQAQAAGVTGARYFEFPQYTGTVFGCDGHPSADLHVTMGQQIAAQMAQDLGWN